MIDRSNFIQPSDIQSHLPQREILEGEAADSAVPSGENAGRFFQLKAACHRMLSVFTHYIWEKTITWKLNRNIAVLNKELRKGQDADIDSLYEGVNQLRQVCHLLREAKVSQDRLSAAEHSLDSIRNSSLALRHTRGARELKDIAGQTLPEQSKKTMEEFHRILNPLIKLVMQNPDAKSKLGSDDMEVIRKWYATQQSSLEYTPKVLFALSTAIDPESELAENYINSCFDLGCYYDFEAGEQKDPVKAAQMYHLAAERGHAESQCNLGYCFETGKGVEKNLGAALQLYHLAANQGNLAALCNLAYFFEAGKGVQQNHEVATKLYGLAASKGSPRAQCNLGVCYAAGRGVERDLGKAVALYQEAANQDYPQAQFNLGHCYEMGQGVEKDLTKARELYRMAAQQGHVAAKEQIEKLAAASI